MFSFDFLKYLINRLRLILLVEIVTIVITLIILIWFVKPWFRSSTTVILTEEGGNSLVSALASNLPIGLGAFGQSDASKYLAILNSDRVADSVIKKFNLQKVYESEFYDLTVKEYRNNLSFIDNDDKTFSISFDYKDNPERAAEIVQYLYDVLYQITAEVEKKSAKMYSVHLSKYLERKKEELKNAEDSLSLLQKTNNFIEPEVNAELLFNNIIILEKERIQTELNKYVIASTKGKNAIELHALNTRLNYVERQIESLYSSSNRANELTLNQLSDVSLAYYRLYRAIEVNSKVVEFLQLQYEQAILDEQKQTVNIDQLTLPRVPDVKVKPKRLTMLIVSLFLVNAVLLIGLRVDYLMKKNKDKIAELLS